MSDIGTRAQNADADAGIMAWVPGGRFTMGSNAFYPEEAPPHPVEVDGFWMDPEPVTNEKFARFVAATGHVTLAEMVPRGADFAGIDPALLQAGSLVFVAPPEPVPLDDPAAWWRYMAGADWRHPKGPDSSLHGLEQHPVVHVSYADALAYARWAGRQLPSEAEWEWAAWGGRQTGPYVWGDQLAPDGRNQANIWQGVFPHHNTAEGGHCGTTPVGAFPANGWGLRDMIGNVWEWTEDLWHAHHAAPAARPCCIPRNPRAAQSPADSQFRRVLKGGSHLCAPNYCQRYRPPARQGQPGDSSTSHIGFRCILRP